MNKKIIWVMVLALFVIAIVVASIYINKKGQEYIQDSQTGNMLNADDSAGTTEENTINENEEADHITVIEVTDQTFEQEVLNSDIPVLIDFYADWCVPCRIFSPIVEEVAQENSDIKVVKVNVDESQAITTKYQIMSMPTLVVIKDGNEVTRSIGIISKSEILNMIK